MLLRIMLSLKTADFAEMLASKIKIASSFPEVEVELERRLTLQAIRSQQEQS